MNQRENKKSETNKNKNKKQKIPYNNNTKRPRIRAELHNSELGSHNIFYNNKKQSSEVHKFQKVFNYILAN